MDLPLDLTTWRDKRLAYRCSRHEGISGINCSSKFGGIRMPNPYGAPEIDVTAVAEKIKNKEPIVLVDVREKAELMRVSLNTDQLVVLPLSELARKQLD